MSIVINMKINIGSTITESTKHIAMTEKIPDMTEKDSLKHC